MWIVITIFILALITIVWVFNRLVRCRFLTREAWSGMDVQLKRRHDLIPNLVEAVKNYAQYERGVLTEITNIRTKLAQVTNPKEQTPLENGLSQAFKNIFALAEAYPDLKANKSYLELQKGLTEIEDQIQLARRYYNGTVRNYNIAVESFPGNLVAALFNFKPEDFFEIEYATERNVPDVKFGG